MPQLVYDGSYEEVGLMKDSRFLSKGTTVQRDDRRTNTWTSSTRERSKAGLRRTAHLDGLRGFAALLVYVLHHQIEGHTGKEGQFILEQGWGWHGNRHFATLPIIRTFFTGGHFGVAIFFVLSGYCLSMKGLTLIQRGEQYRLGEVVGSGFFRRWLRLYIPIFCTTFIWMSILWALNLSITDFMAKERSATYPGEIKRWLWGFLDYSYLYSMGLWLQYNGHVWSIPFEYRGSQLVYLVLLAVAKCRKNVRLMIELGLLFYFLYVVDAWYCALFMGGLLLCDLDLLAERHQLPPVFTRLQVFSKWSPYAALFVGLYLGGVPSAEQSVTILKDTLGWHYLYYVTPHYLFDFRPFWRVWGAVLTIYAIPRIPTVKAFFETQFCQYLGRISYGFYLAHGPILWSIGDRLYAACGRYRAEHFKSIPGWVNRFPFPDRGPLGLELNLLLPHLIILPLSLWAGELVTKYIDEPAINLVQRLYNKALEPEHLPTQSNHNIKA